MFLQSELLARAGVRHGFGSRSEPVPGIFSEYWLSKKPVWSQVHEARAVEVREPGQDCGKTDALFTSALEQPIAVVTADCVPVLLARRDGRGAAAVHAGWRGTKARILRSLFEELTAKGEKPSDWIASVGPSIGPCCYEVSEELAVDFAREFGPSHGEALAVPRFRHLDLPAINAAELRALGLAEVELLRACTRCSLGADGQPLYHSYRREGGGTRQYSMIEISGGK